MPDWRAVEKGFVNWLRNQGWPLVHRAEPSRYRYKDTRGKTQHRSRSHDLFGTIDVVAVDHGRGIWFVQLTTPKGRSARMAKLTAQPWPVGPDIRVSVVWWEEEGEGGPFWGVADLNTSGGWDRSQIPVYEGGRT